VRAAVAAVVLASSGSAACQSSSGASAPEQTVLPASCPEVADHLASLEIGNYAPEPVRERQIARDLGACEAARVTEDEGRCIDVATTREAAEACAPRMQLDIGCARVIDKVRVAAKKPAGLDAQLDAELARGFAVMETACNEDGWPRELKACIVKSSAMEPCVKQFPKELRDRLAKRVMDELSPAPR
jgi:hypothetical protein